MTTAVQFGGAIFDARSVLFSVLGLFFGLILYPLATYLLCKLLLTQHIKRDLTLQLQKSEEHYRELTENISDVIWTCDLDFNHNYISPSIEKMIGEPKEVYIKRSMREKFSPEDLKKIQEILSEELKKDKDQGIDPNRSRIIEAKHLKPDGTCLWISMHISFMRNEQGDVIGFRGTTRAIQERKQAEEEIVYISYHDYLTGLKNRRCFEEEKKRLDTEENLPLTFISADIDRLKLVNDGFGYGSGDQYLVEAAKILEKCCRPEDSVFRTGGDEFCILLPNASAETGRNVVKKIRLLCESTFIDFGTVTIKPSISMGCSTKFHSDESFSDVIMQAENSMRRSKLLQGKSVRSDLLSTIKATMIENSHETAEHAQRIVKFSLAIGEELNLSEDKLLKLELASALHDIGKMSIDHKILTKKDSLTQEEWNEIRKHPEAGYRIAQATSELMPVSDYILLHHERWDGKGYPQGLTGKQIPLIDRIIAIADSYDAMTQDRPYRAALTKEHAISELVTNAGTQFDPEIVKIFIEKVIKPGKF